MLNFAEAFFAVMTTISHPVISTTHGNDLRQLFCLSEAVYFEASDQSILGKEAVAFVVKNRADDKKTNYCKEISRPYQFSYKNDNAYQAKTLDLRNPHTVSKIKTVIYSAWRVQSGLEQDTTNKSTSYLNPKIATDFSWMNKLQKTVVIGDHHFYKKKLK